MVSVHSPATADLPRLKECLRGFAGCTFRLRVRPENDSSQLRTCGCSQMPSRIWSRFPNDFPEILHPDLAVAEIILITLVIISLQ